MIVVDIGLDGDPLIQAGSRCLRRSPRSRPDVLISAGTMAEALLVAAHRNVRDEMETLIKDSAFEVISVTPAAARRIAAAHKRWGKGVHPAGLDFGDCFAYEAAKEHACPLLFVGNDFTKTDIASAL